MESDGVAPDEVPNIRSVNDRDVVSDSTREKVQPTPRIKHEMNDSMLVADTVSSTREDVPPVPRIKRERDDCRGRRDRHRSVCTDFDRKIE